MKKKQNEYWPSVIIHNGKPYVLKKMTRKDVNHPCALCDLSYMCTGVSVTANFYELCTSDERGDNYYYEEDWSIYDKMIADFVDTKLT